MSRKRWDHHQALTRHQTNPVIETLLVFPTQMSDVRHGMMFSPHWIRREMYPKARNKHQADNDHMWVVKRWILLIIRWSVSKSKSWLNFWYLFLFGAFAFLYLHSLQSLSSLQLLHHIHSSSSNNETDFTFSSIERCTGGGRGEWTDSSRHRTRCRHSIGIFHPIHSTESISIAHTTIPDTPIIIETIIPHPDPHHIESDPVASTIGEEQRRTLKEKKTEESNNPSPQARNQDYRTHNESRTTERISNGTNEEITLHLAASISREVYHSQYTFLSTQYTILILSRATNIWHMSQLSSHRILDFLGLRQFQHVRQFHLINRSLARSSINLGHGNHAWKIMLGNHHGIRHPIWETCVPHQCSCNCNSETKEPCVRKRKTMQGSSSYSSLDFTLSLSLTHTHPHPHPHTHTGTHPHTHSLPHSATQAPYRRSIRRVKFKYSAKSIR